MFSGFESVGYDKDIARENANKNCKLCYGRGLVKIRYPKYNAAVTDYCGCVRKKLDNDDNRQL